MNPDTDTEALSLPLTFTEVKAEVDALVAKGARWGNGRLTLPWEPEAIIIDSTTSLSQRNPTT